MSLDIKLNNQQTPLTYSTWQQVNKLVGVNTDENIQNYNAYILNWYNNKQISSTNDTETIVAIYTNFLSEIIIQYSTVDEQRFLSNINLNDPRDLDILIPYITTKLKNISQYFVNKREDVKYTKIKNSIKGSNYSIEKDIFYQILQTLSDQDIIQQFHSTTNVPLISSILLKLQIKIDELYDTSTKYFDQPKLINSFSILDLAKAVVNQLYLYPVSLQINPLNVALTTNNNIVILINTKRDSIYDLPLSEFVNGIQSYDNLNLSLNRYEYHNFIGTNYSFLSTNNVTTDFISGGLFNANNIATNYLNRFFPSQFFIPTDIVYTKSQIGSFFIPSNIGILSFMSFTDNISINTAEISTNSLYSFPQLNLYSGGRGNSRTDQSIIFNYTENTLDQKIDSANYQLAGYISDNNIQHQRFYPYQSREETLNFQPAGITRISDNFNFFSGSLDSIWTNKDLYPILPLTPFPINTRINDLLITNDIVYEWQTDIFGNEFALLKNIEAKTLYPILPSLNKYSTIYEPISSVRTLTIDEFNLSNDKNLYNKFTSNGTIVCRTCQTPYIKNFTASLSAIFIKYNFNPNIMNELNQNVKTFKIANNTIIIQTDSFIICEQYNYNFDIDSFTGTTSNRNYIEL